MVPAVVVDQTTFDQLWFEQKRLREDFDRLLRCLGETVCRSSWQFHREKFRAACRRDHTGPNVTSFQEALDIKTLRLVQQLCGGREEMRALREVSTSSRACAESILNIHDVYVFGGNGTHGGNPVKSAACFNVQDQEWKALPPAPATPIGVAGATLDEHVYICGGYGMLGNVAQRFNTATRTWEQLAPMKERRFQGAAAVVGGQIYVIGGESPEYQVHDTIEVFDALAPYPGNPRRAGVWRLLSSPMSTQRRNLGAATIGGAGHLLLCGGTATPNSQAAAKGSVPLASAEALELRGPRPRPRGLPPMPMPRMSHVVACLRGRVYACGGHTGKRVVLSSVVCYNAATEAWSTSPPMALGRSCAAAAVVAGRLLVLGGYCSGIPGAPAERTVQRLDPTTGAWEVMDWELPHGRMGFCAGAVWRGALAA